MIMEKKGLWKNILESKYDTWRNLNNKQENRKESWWWKDMRRATSDTTQTHKKMMTKDANYEESSQQSREDLISRRNGQGPEHLKFFLLVFLNN